MRKTRDEVFAIVAGEMDYAKKHDVARSQFPDSVGDADKPVEVWLLWMEEYLAKARAAATAGYNKTDALSFLRSALSLGMNCAMYHGLPSRLMMDFVRDAERAIAANALSENEAYVLRAKIERLKDGQESLDETDTFDEWLEQLRHHHP